MIEDLSIFLGIFVENCTLGYPRGNKSMSSHQKAALGLLFLKHLEILSNGGQVVLLKIMH